MATTSNHNPNYELKKVIKEWVSRNVETTSVGVVVNVDEYPKSRVVDVLPLTMERFDDGSALVPDTVYRCPVVLQGTQEGFISYPIKVGDKVLIGYCKRSFAEYLYSAKSEQYLPDDLSVFGANNVVVYGYLSQDGVDLEVSPDDFQVAFKDCLLTFKDNNDILIKNSTVNIEATNAGVITITNGSSTLVIDGGESTLTSNLTVDGNLTVTGSSTLSSNVTSGGKDISDTHTHGGVSPGGSNTAVPN